MADVRAIQTDPVAGLIDIPLPQPVSLWPQTLTSRITVLLLAASVVAVLWWFIRHWQANRYRREALAELKRIARSQGSSGCDEEQVLELSRLVRRTALAAFPREAVAPLTGVTWLSFLDRSYGGQDFSQGAGCLLASVPYQHTPPKSIRLKELTRLVRKWIKVHHA